MTKRISVTINADGSIVAKSAGHEGPTCMGDLAVIMALCDTAVIIDSKLTAEYYESTTIHVPVPNEQQNLENASDR